MTAMAMADPSPLKSATARSYGSFSIWYAACLTTVPSTASVGCPTVWESPKSTPSPSAMHLQANDVREQCSGAHVCEGHLCDSSSGGRPAGVLKGCEASVQQPAANFCGRAEHGVSGGAACSAERPEPLGRHHTGHSHHPCGNEPAAQVITTMQPRKYYAACGALVPCREMQQHDIVARAGLAAWKVQL